jgi:hypothetical protein
VRLAALLALLVACGGHDDPPPDACAPAVLYLNKSGGMWDHGGRDDASANLSLLVDMPRTLPPWPKSASDWTELVACMRTALAPFPITVTETDPAPATHTEIVFTTEYWGGTATTSIIPDSCRPGHQVEFVFGDAIATRARACHVALRAYAQMVANLSLGDHCEDVLNDQMDCTPDRFFTDLEVHCVDAANQPAPCRCGGTTQNSFQTLLAATTTCP